MEHTEETQTEQVQQQPVGVSEAPVSGHTPRHGGAKRGWLSGHRRKLYALAVLLVLVVIAGAAWFFAAGHQGYDENKGINKNEYQAVFLTNGQVYFGKLADLNHKYVTITDIYYLQVQQGSNGSLQDASGSSSSSSQVSLAKLGNELHGPEDKMSISSDQVLFWENLKTDSKVVQAITKYQNQ